MGEIELAVVERREWVWVGTCRLDHEHKMRVVEELSVEAEPVPQIELPCDQCSIAPPPNVTLELIAEN